MAGEYYTEYKAQRSPSCSIVSCLLQPFCFFFQRMDAALIANPYKSSFIPTVLVFLTELGTEPMAFSLNQAVPGLFCALDVFALISTTYCSYFNPKMNDILTKKHTHTRDPCKKEISCFFRRFAFSQYSKITEPG